MNLSIIIPAYNESESLNELHDWISKVVKRMNVVYEIIIIDDCSTDNSIKVTSLWYNIINK